MAFTTLLLTVSLVAITNAGFVWVDDDNDFPGVSQPKMNNRNFGPSFPSQPRLPRGFPNFPAFPKIVFPTFPPIPMPVIPSIDEIKNKKVGKGESFNAMAVTSNGGGTTIYVKNNDEEHEFKVGDNPPNIDDPIKIPPFPKMPKMPEFKPLVFEPITFKPITFKPIVVPTIDPKVFENYEPGDNENFSGVSVSSYSHSSNVNGVKSSGGGVVTVVNDNGKIEKKSMKFGDDNKPEDK